MLYGGMKTLSYGKYCIRRCLVFRLKEALFPHFPPSPLYLLLDVFAHKSGPMDGSSAVVGIMLVRVAADSEVLGQRRYISSLHHFMHVNALPRHLA